MEPPIKESGNQPPAVEKSAANDLDYVAERAQVDSVLRIIQESIEKLKISLILPQVLDNIGTLHKTLKGTQYEKCVNLAKAYLEENEKHDCVPELNYPLIKLIDIFHENFQMLDVLPNWLDDLEPSDKALLDAFTLLLQITEQRFKKSAVSELNKEKKIHEIYHENESVKRTIAEYQSKLRNQKISLRWKNAAKEGVIQKYEEELAFKKWDNNVRIKEEIVKSSWRIRNIHTSSVQKQKELEDELEKSREAYKNILKQNLKQEKEARDEKNKLLIQLQTIIHKYDQNIGEKIKENLYLEEVYAEKKKLFDEFLIEYQREEQEYEAIVHEKEEKERRKHEEKLMLFMMNRAARVIQRFWRKFQREQKKKAKKGKGKGKKK